MKTITVLFQTDETGITSELERLEKSAGVSRAEVAKLLSERFRTKVNLEGVVYGFFRRGERIYPKKKIEGLAEILKVDVGVIIDLNSLIKKTESLSLPANFNVRDAIESLPSNMSSLSDFLLWVDLVNKRSKVH